MIEHIFHTETSPVRIRKLPKGGTIGITSPASTPDQDKLKRGITYLENRGFKVIVGSTCYSQTDYLAGNDAQRADELLDFIENDDIDAIFCSRGGFGSIKLLRMLDYELIREKRKLLVGFSDITFLLWAIYAQTGVGGISGFMPAYNFCSPDLPVQEEAHFWNLIHGGTIEYETQSKLLPIGNAAVTSVTGKALAGTLSLVSKLIGTPYFPSLANHLVFLEDVDERIHKIESYLEHISLSGVLQSCSGLILGEFTPAESEEYKVLPKQEDVFQRVLRNVRIPMLYGFNYGHIPNLFSVPIGMELTVHLGENKILIESTQPFFES